MKQILKCISALALIFIIAAAPAARASTYTDSAPMGGKGIVLVLSGGGTKGLAHLGVFEVLEKEKIPITAIVGTSMGAIMGGFYSCGYSVEEMKEILKESDLMEIISGRSNANPPGESRYCRAPGTSTGPFTMYVDGEGNVSGAKGVLRGKDIYAFLTEMTARASVTDFNQLPIPFAAVATDLETGAPVILREGNLASALRASLSIPIIFDPWEVDGKLLVDGGLVANLPVMIAKELFPNHPIVAVNLSDRNITRERSSLSNLMSIAEQSLEILMVNQIRENAAAADAVISPRVSSFGVLDADGYDKIIELGVEAAERGMPQVRSVLENYVFASDVPPTSRPVGDAPIVAEVDFEGVPESMERELREDFRHWVGRPLDMKKLSDTVKILSDREEFISVQGKTRDLPDNKVEVQFYIERPPKYEFGMSLYTGNIHPDRWIAVNATARDVFTAGDVAAAEVRMGSDWGTMLRYFTPTDERESQWGVLLAARDETYEPKNSDEIKFTRYAGRAGWYRNIGKSRIGIGYAADYSDIYDRDFMSGPFLSYSINTTDDPILPTRGTEINTELWYPFGEALMTHTRFKCYFPFVDNLKMVLSGGLKTGDADKFPYAAALGSREELYSLASNPLLGDQVWWVHLGTGYTLTKSWWGGIDVEIFGRYGQAMVDWSEHKSWWEVGVGLVLPTNSGNGRLILVYDKDGDVTFGYSIGIPHFWKGPLP